MAAIDYKTVNQYTNNAACILNCVPEGAQKGVLIALLMRLNSMAITPATIQTLLSDAKCVIQCIPEGAQMGVLNSLASQLLGSGISGVTGVYSGNGDPNGVVTPAGGAALYIQKDSVPAGQVWWWDGAAWN